MQFFFRGEIVKDVVVYLGETSFLNNDENNFHVRAEDIFIHYGRTSMSEKKYEKDVETERKGGERRSRQTN